MKHFVKAILLLLMLFSVSSLVTNQVKGVSPGELVQPGVAVEGTLTTQNSADTFGVETLGPGLYNLSLQVYGDGCSATLREFAGGTLASTLASTNSNNSKIFQIYPEGEYVDTPFSISVKLGTYSTKCQYILKLDKINLDGNIELNQSTYLKLDHKDSSWFTLEIPEEVNAFRISFENLSSTESAIGLVMDLSGVIKDFFSCYIADPIEWIPINSGTYYLELSQGTDTEGLEFQIDPMKVHVLQAEENVSFEFNETNENSVFFYRLNVEEGVSYEINLDVDNSLDAGFIIQRPDFYGSYIYEDKFRAGESESVSDLVFFGQSVCYSDWAFRNGEYRQIVPRTLGNPVFQHYHSNYGFDLSSVSIQIFRISGLGKATLSLREIGVAKELLEGQTDNIEFDSNGPLWYLYKVEGLDGMSAYNMTFENLASNSMPTPSYFLAHPLISDAIYLNYQRPFQSALQNSVLDKILDTTFYHGWGYDNSFTVNKELFYNSIDCVQWLLISYEDRISGELPPEDLSADFKITITKCPEYEISTNYTQQVDVANEGYIVLKTNLESDHTYRVEVDHLNYSTYSTNIMVYNESGHAYFDVIHDGSWRPQEISESTAFTDFLTENRGIYAILLHIVGDGRVNVVVFDITEQKTILQPDIILIAGTGCIGLIAGLILGRASLFGSKSELHMS